ncbi:MAG: PepSY-associated TM helix domain-containing protein [Bacteroidia bacterium]
MAGKRKNTFRSIIGKLHLWLGLASGLVVFIVAITGCIYVFQHEIQELTQPWRFVTPQEVSLAPSELLDIARTELPDKQLQRLYVEDPGHAAYALFYGEDGHYYSVFINQYTGDVIKVKNLRRDFFTIILYLHISLLLPGDIGTDIISYASLIFLFMMISGIIMWWPKSIAARKQRFSIKWTARWRRVNYDLHNVLGFYMSWVAIFIVITGLVWAFKWMETSVYWVASGGESLPEYARPASDTRASATSDPIDKAWYKVRQEAGPDMAMAIFVPQRPADPITVMANPGMETYYQLSYYYFDRNTLEELPVNHLRGKYSDDASIAEKLNRMNYDIHTGAILGLPGKLMAFFASLLAASLPITGFMLWLGRRKKAKKTLPENRRGRIRTMRQVKTHSEKVKRTELLEAEA